MSIRIKLAGLLLVMLLVLTATTYAVQALVVMPVFVGLEHSAAAQELNRCVEAIDNDIRDLSRYVLDWSAWDETYRFVRGENRTFVDRYLMRTAPWDSGIHVVAVLDRDDRLLWAQIRDPEDGHTIQLPDLLARLQIPNNRLNQHQEPNDVCRGLLRTSVGPLLIASRPVIRSQREGPIEGSIIMGRFLSNQYLRELARRTSTHLEVEVITGAGPAASERAKCRTEGPHSAVIETGPDHTLRASATMGDVFGQPLLGVSVTAPREVSQQGTTATRIATLSSAGGGLAMLWVLGHVLQSQIAAPLRKLAAHAERLGQSDDLKARLDMQRSDEIGVLARALDPMVENLAESRSRVLEAAHRAGMAEVATDTLHNVGNALTSAHCSAEILEERLRHSACQGLHQAANLLRAQGDRVVQFFTSDPRGPQLIEYLFKLDERIERERTETESELGRLLETLQYIREAIAAQQAYARSSNFEQDVELSRVISEAIRLSHNDLCMHGVTVEVDADALPEIHLNKSKLLQVLVNLIKNATQAIAAGGDGSRVVKIRAMRTSQRNLRIEVHDSGIGFDAELGVTLFQHGVTTKQDGNGFGLHYCANAVREMGGHITAESPGPGKGATFIVELENILPAELIRLG